MAVQETQKPPMTSSAYHTEFRVDNVFTTLTTNDPRLRDRLDDLFSYHVNGYQYTPAYRQGLWDGKRHLFAGGKFPTGLLAAAKEVAESLGHRVTITDLRVRPTAKLPRLRGLDGVEEREYQREAVMAAIERSRGVIWHPTGSGKTVTMAAIIQALSLPALVLVDQTWIARQTYDRFRQWLPEKTVGLVTGVKKRDGDIVCATFQALAAQYRRDRENHTSYLKQWLAKFQVLCLDEAHHARARVYQTIINLCPAYYRFGFSATPLRSTFKTTGDKGTKLHLIGSTGPVIDIMTAAEGVQLGVLTPARVRMIRWHPDRPYTYWGPGDFELDDRNYTYSGRKTMAVTDMSGQTRRIPLKQPSPGLYEVGIVRHEQRNRAVVEAVRSLYEQGHIVLVLVSWVEHGEILKPAIEEAIRDEVVFVRGENPQRERDMVRFALQEGHRRVCIATSVFDEGVDVPEISALVYARGGKAQYKVVQAMGRGMRISSGKQQLIVVDFYDTHSRTLFRHARERRKAYESDDAYTLSID